MSLAAKKFDVDDFSRDFNQFTEQVEDNIDKISKEVISETYKELVRRTPVWSGSYLLSHRISVNSEPVEPPTNVAIQDPNGGPYPVKIDPITEQGYRELSKEELSKLIAANQINTIVVSNDIEHALIVEAMHSTYQQAEIILKALVRQKNKDILVKGMSK